MILIQIINTLINKHYIKKKYRNRKFDNDFSKKNLKFFRLKKNTQKFFLAQEKFINQKKILRRMIN